MLTSLHIQGFKGFKDTKVEELRKVNLILGGQNAGKTSLLEAAAFVLMNPYQGQINELPRLFRVAEQQDSARYWKTILNINGKIKTVKIGYSIEGVEYVRKVFKKNTDGFSMSIELDGVGSLDIEDDRLDFTNEENDLEHTFWPSPLTFSAIPTKQSELVRLYGEVVQKKFKKPLTAHLKKIEARLDGLDAVAPDGEHRVYVDLDGEHQLLPMPQLGHGFARLFEIYSQLLISEAKLVLIDEIENGIHYSALPTVFRGIREIAESKDVQTMITTHSWECVRAACEVFKDKPEDFQAIRLERDGDNIVAVCIPGDRVLRMVEQDMEIR